MKPSQKTFTLLFLFLIARLTGQGLEVEGQTTGGLAFAGHIISLHSGSLYVVAESGETADSLGIPIDSLASVRLKIRAPYEAGLTRRLETLVPLLPALDRESLQSLLDWTRVLGESGDWAGAYLWSGRIVQTCPEPGLLLSAELLEAQSLQKLGLSRELGQRLKQLNHKIEPLQAPLLLCQLNSFFHKLQDEPEQSRFWQEIPKLQIPSKADQPFKQGNRCQSPR